MRRIVFILSLSTVFFNFTRSAQAAQSTSPVSPLSPDSPEILSFSVAFKKMVDSDPNLIKARATVRNADNQVLASSGHFLPNLGLNSSLTNSNDSASRTLSYGLSSQWNLYHFGIDKAAHLSAKWAQDSERNKLLLVQATSEMDSAHAILSVLAEASVYKIANQVFAVKSEFIEIAKSRFKMGLLSEQELQKLEIDYHMAAISERDQLLTLNKVKEHLRTLLGAGYEVADEWPWKKEIIEFNSLRMKDFDIKDHPAFKDSYAQSQASKNLVEASPLISPSLDFMVSTSESKPEGAPNSTSSWSTGLSLSVPLFSGWSDLAKRRSAIESQTVSLVNLARKTGELEEALSIAEKQFQLSQASIKDRDRTFQLADKLTKDNAIRFKAGRATVNELLVDQERLAQAQILYARGWLQTHLNFLALCHARGKLAADCISKLTN